MTPTEILDAVHAVTGCSPDRIVSKGKHRGVLYPRWIALMLLREARPFPSDNELGRPLGMLGSGTARYALKAARQLLTQDDAFRGAYEQSLAILNQPKPTT